MLVTCCDCQAVEEITPLFEKSTQYLFEATERSIYKSMFKDDFM